MKKVLSVLVALAFTCSSLSLPAVAAIKVGASCGSKGQVKTSSGYKYTCIKSGKKLVWSKGVKVAVEVAPTPTPTPTPTTIPVAPSSFNNLQSRIDGIIYGAWLNASEKINGSVTTLGITKILVGPNTIEDDANSLASLNLASRLFQDFPQVKNLYLIKFSKSDVDWAQKQYDILRPNNYDPNVAVNQCSGRNGCDGGSAGINSDGAGVIMMAQGGSYIGQPLIAGGSRVQNGLTLAHEYIHTIQMFNAPCRGGKGCYGDAPVWLLEGGATWLEAATRFSGNFSDFLLARNASLGSHYSKASSTYTSEYINLYLNPNPVFLPNEDNWKYWSKYDRWEAYALGLMVSEILVNIKGTASLMKLYADVGAGKSFVDAFQGIFDITWAEACPIIADAIAAELKQGIKK